MARHAATRRDTPDTGRRAYAKGSARNPCRPFAHWRGNAGAIVLRHSAYAVHSYDFEVEEYV